MIQHLVAHECIEQAYREILPMVEWMKPNNAFFEWYTVDNQPRGSATYRFLVKWGAQRMGDLSPQIMCTNLAWSDRG